MKQKEVYDHVATLNREMGEVKTEIVNIKGELTQINQKIKDVDNKSWLILSTLIITVLVQIYLKLV